MTFQSLVRKAFPQVLTRAELIKTCSLSRPGPQVSLPPPPCGDPSAKPLSRACQISQGGSAPALFSLSDPETQVQTQVTSPLVPQVPGVFPPPRTGRLSH